MHSTTSPAWYKPIVILAVLWNCIGIFNFYSQLTMSADEIAQLPSGEQALMLDIPLWTTIAFGIGVFGGTLGSLGLLMKKAWSKTPLLLSLIAVFFQMTYWLFFTKSVVVYGPTTYIMPLVVILIAYLLLKLCLYGIREGYIH